MKDRNPPIPIHTEKTRVFWRLVMDNLFYRRYQESKHFKED